MGYPPQGPWGQPPQQGGYPQQGYGQGQPQQNFGQGGFGPQGPGFGGQGGGGEYNFAQLYGQADHSAGTLLERGRYLAQVEEASWGRTKDGTKGAWTIVFRTVSGINKMQGAPGQGAKLTITISVSPTKQDGTENKGGLGIMFKQLHALGIMVGPPHDSGPAFWEQGHNEQMVAQEIMRQQRVVELTVTQNEYPEGSGQFNNKISRIDPASQPAPQAAPQQPFGGPQQAPQQPYGAPQPQQAPQPWQPPQQPQQGQGYGQGYGQAQQFQGGPGVHGQPTQGMGQTAPGVPPYAQPAQPGQPGLGQFTQPGQGVQPGTVPGHDQNGQPPGPPAPQQGQGPQQGQQGPPLPPWA